MTICYADDTIVLAVDDDWLEAKSRANEALAGVVSVIRALDLKVAPNKSEAMFFHNESHGKPLTVSVSVRGTNLIVGTQLKYLGLILDERTLFNISQN